MAFFPRAEKILAPAACDCIAAAWRHHCIGRRQRLSALYLFDFLSVNKAYEHILAIVTGLLALTAISGKSGFLYAALTLALLSLLFPAFARRAAQLWMGFAVVLGRLMNGLILSVIFFLLLSPLALLARITRREPPLMKKKPLSTAFITVDKRFNPEDFEKTW